MQFNVSKMCIYAINKTKHKRLNALTVNISSMSSILGLGVRAIALNATFSNISIISWRYVLMVEETGVPGENHERNSNSQHLC